MDNFNDFYNHFVASYYGSNVISYIFFVTVFFVVILFGVVVVLLKYRNVVPAQDNGRVRESFDEPIFIEGKDSKY